MADTTNEEGSNPAGVSTAEPAVEFKLPESVAPPANKPTTNAVGTSAEEKGGVGDDAQTAAARVAKYESSNNPTIGVGGTDLANAPVGPHGAPIWDGHGNSHAFGLYQFEPATWDRYAAPLGITDWRAPGAQDEVFRAAYRNEGYAPWAPYDKRLASEIGWKGAPPETYAADMATHARLNGFTWDEINQEIDGATNAAKDAGAPENAVDTYLGYGSYSALEQRLADTMAEKPYGAPPAEVSDGVVRNPSQTSYGAYTAPETAAGPITPAIAIQYAQAMNNGEVKGPDDFAKAYTDQLWSAAGLTEIADEHKAKAAQDIAAQLPALPSFVDSAIYSLRDYGLPVTADNARATRANYANLWARSGLQPTDVAQGHDPVLQEALTTPDGIMRPDQKEPPPPKLTFGEAMRETGEQIADAAKGFVKGLLETAAIPGNIYEGKQQPSEQAALDFATTFGLGGAPTGAVGSGVSKRILGGSLDVNGTAKSVVRTAATETDRLLNRIVTRSKATKLELGQAVDKIPVQFRDEAFQKKVYQSIEQRLVDPKYAHAPEVQSYLTTAKALTDREHALAQKVATELADKHPEMSRVFALTNVEGGYVHRIRVGKEAPNGLQAQLQAGQEERNAATGAKQNLSEYSSSMEDRTAGVWEDEKGHRLAFDWNREGNLKFGQTGVIQGQKWTFRPATSDEITASSGQGVGAASRTIQFHENHLVNTVENIQRLERVSDNLEFMKHQLGDLQTQGMFHPETSQFATGPQGFVHVDLPGAKGWAEPKVAHVLNDFYNHSLGDIEAFSAKVNHFIMASLFMTPVVHPLNVLQNFTVSRGWKWLNPVGYGTLAVDGARAIKEVLSVGPRYLQHIREGNGLMFPNMLPEVQNFHNAMIGKMIHDMSTRSHIWKDYAKGVGKGIAKFSIRDITHAQLHFSHSMTWMLNDVLMLTREFEHERMGRSVAEAIQKTEQDIVAYRIPSSINRVIHGFYSNPLLTMFGRYDYGQLRGMALMVKQALAGSPLTSRREAIGKLTVLLGLGLYGYPKLNHWLQQTTGNPNAQVNSFGYQKFVHAGAEVAQGRWWAAVGTIFHLTPAIEILDALSSGLGKFGQPLIKTAGTWGETAVSVLEAIANVFPITQDMLTAAQHAKNTTDFVEQYLGQFAGVRLGPGQPNGQKLYWQNRDARTQRHQIQKDRIQQGAHAVGGWLTQHGL